MRRRITFLLAYLSVTLLAVFVPMASFAQPGAPPEVYTEPGGLHTPQSMAPTNGVVTVMLELAGPALGSGNPTTSAAQIEREQQTVVQQLASLQAHVAITHVAVDFGLRNECRDRVDHDQVDRI